MDWTSLTDLQELETLDRRSAERDVLIFKHSTRCIISRMVLGRLEREWDQQDRSERPVYLLDLLRHRPISNAIAQRYGVEHQSPQVLVIRNGRCVYSATHEEIQYQDLQQELQQ